jgi:hypothetical protein
MVKFVAALAATAAALVLAPTASADFEHLQPGVPRADLREQVPINVVFVGLDPGGVRADAFSAGLPSRYKPVVRSRGELLGIHYAYDYAVTYTGDAWENGFFAALRRMARPAPRTAYQDFYNEQPGTRDVGRNHFIDAPSVEKWLIDHAPPGVDTRENTIFFINWWGRADFVDHVYTKFGEPDPDTGYDFCRNREDRKIIAWGGTPPDDEETGLGRRGVHRAWFFDLSAGPEAWGGNFDITHADLDGDGEPDYRIPVAWEYAADGYRSPARLASDLGKLARYVAINLLFTSSPTYPPYLTPELLPTTINLDLNTYEGWTGTDASRLYQTPALLRQELGELLPVPLTSDTQDLAFGDRTRGCLVRWFEGRTCFPNRPQYPPFANLFLNNALNLADALDQTARERRTSRIYEAPAFNYATTFDPPLLGLADQNYRDGTQSFIYTFVSPGIVEAGYGLTTSQIHEYGHHFGMSHPHDGYDWQTGTDYEPTGPYYFAWAGDENNSMMSYVDLNWDFSQFDRDNAARHHAAGYILNANVIAGRVLESQHADRTAALLAAADASVGRAEAAIAAHDYPATWRNARAGYELVLRAARRADVRVTASHNGWVVLPRDPQAAEAVLDYAVVDRIGAGAKRTLR